MVFKLKKKSYKTINELFEEWKERHNTECKESYSKTAPADEKDNIPDYDEFKGSFCHDGYLGEGEEEKANILFICRESNVSGKISDNYFWLKEVVKAKMSGEYYIKDYTDVKNRKRDRAAQTKYFNCLNNIINNFQNTKTTIHLCGYMNINKRGGFSSCSFKQLENYAVLYKNYILKEIELLNPNFIVILGKLPCEIISIIKESNKPIYQYSFHPSRYRKLETHTDYISQIN